MTQPREDSPHGPHPLVGCKPLLGEGGEGRSITLLPAFGEREAEQSCQPECGVGVGKRTQLLRGQWQDPGLENIRAERAGGLELSAGSSP